MIDTNKVNGEEFTLHEIQSALEGITKLPLKQIVAGKSLDESENKSESFNITNVG
jgi:hypothetical protein